MTVDEKLDYLIGKVENLEREIQEIKTANDKRSHSLESKFYDIFSGLRDTVSHMDSSNYKYYSELGSTLREVSRRVDKVEEHTPINQFIDKVLPWSPAILISGAVWTLIIYVILNS